MHALIRFVARLPPLLPIPTTAFIKCSATAVVTSVRAATGSAEVVADAVSGVAVVAEMGPDVAVVATVTRGPTPAVVAGAKNRRTAGDNVGSTGSRPMLPSESPRGDCIPWHGGIYLHNYRYGGIIEGHGIGFR